MTASPVMSDTDLLELVQRQTFRYFWDWGHPVSRLARDRASRDVVTVGGTGFGIMAMVVAAERGWVPRADVIARLAKIIAHLENAEAYHGVFPHFMDGATGKIVPFGPRDDGGDLVETSFLVQGLLTARQYFAGDTPVETDLRARIDALWMRVDWAWHTRGEKALTWHWSPTCGWAMDMRIRGWNECLITYLLAASAPQHRIEPDVYHMGWAQSGAMRNGARYYGIELPLGPAMGGPLFFSHYSFLGLDPRGLKDRYADYWQQNVNHTRINHAYCLENPKSCRGYGEASWGLTASDNSTGYNAHAPNNDRCVITPTAALSSFPYCPELAMPALRHFFYDLGPNIWRQYGFTDAFSEEAGWYSSDHLAIDQGPIIIMIENYRTGLLWRLFMSCPEIQAGLDALGFERPRLS